MGTTESSGGGGGGNGCGALYMNARLELSKKVINKLHYDLGCVKLTQAILEALFLDVNAHPDQRMHVKDTLTRPNP